MLMLYVPVLDVHLRYMLLDYHFNQAAIYPVVVIVLISHLFF